MPELLLELFSEEIPARMQKRAASELERLVTAGLKDAGLGFEQSQSFVTPRRLVLVVDGLPDKQPDVSEERKGPQVGAPEQAINGFLGSLGGLTLDDCEQREIKGKTFWFAVTEKKGQAMAIVLQDILKTAIDALPWPKSMRWGTSSKRWVRPLHSILCLFDGEQVKIDFEDIASGNVTAGHRFLAPEVFEVTDFTGYKTKLNSAKVMIDSQERRESIRLKADELAASETLTVKLDDGLLDEVAGLVEWPVVLMGEIDAEFMSVPQEVLISAMRGHQKYLSCLDADGKLANRFIVVSNMQSGDGGAAIVAGNERVLRARLSDARYFWDQDRAKGLESRLEKLAGVVFHARLGSVLQKVDRLVALAGTLSIHVPGADAQAAEQAAKLCKADLTTEMVGEFPELQGLMGRYYALEGGESSDVANALAEHYSPAGPADACPSQPLSITVALSDKIDTLVGFFAMDEKPTGSKDPYALRRAALGVIRLIIENDLRLKLGKVFAEAVAAYVGQENEAVKEGLNAFDTDGLVATDNLNAWHMPDLLAFFADRMKVHLKEQGVRHDLIDAVFALGEDDLVRILARVEALGDFVATDDGANLLVAYRRAANILKIEEKKDGRSYDGLADETALQQEEERSLFTALAEVRAKCTENLSIEDDVAAMTALAELRRPVDTFFDEVTVNIEDVSLRENRLKLLAGIRSVMGDVADFSKIEGS